MSFVWSSSAIMLVMFVAGGHWLKLVIFYNITLGHKYWLVHYKFGGCWSEISVWRCKIIIERILSQGDKFWWIMVVRSQLIYFNCLCLSFSLHTIFVQWKIHSNCIYKISLATESSITSILSQGDIMVVRGVFLIYLHSQICNNWCRFTRYFLFI